MIWRRFQSGFMRGLIEAQKREQAQAVADIVVIHGLMPLLMKHRNGAPWTREERLQLHAQLRAVAHLSPYLLVFLLPGSFLLLPFLAWWLDRRHHRR